MRNDAGGHGPPYVVHCRKYNHEITKLRKTRKIVFLLPQPVITDLLVTLSFVSSSFRAFVVKFRRVGPRADQKDVSTPRRKVESSYSKA
jgi:hypothetical protein